MNILDGASAIGRKARSARVTHRTIGYDALDLRALQHLAPLINEYLPWSASALAPRTALQLCNELALNDRRLILELGSGISTMLIAMWSEAEQEPVKVVSIDEDQTWIDLLERKLERFKYADVSFLHAPLVPYERQDDSPPVTRWYDASVVEAVAGPVEMLLVDGPTAYKREWRFDRWPALPRFLDRLAPACAVLLDDTDRPGESAILRSWRGSYGGFTASPSGRATWLRRGVAWQT